MRKMLCRVLWDKAHLKLITSIHIQILKTSQCSHNLLYYALQYIKSTVFIRLPHTYSELILKMHIPEAFGVSLSRADIVHLLYIQ